MGIDAAEAEGADCGPTGLSRLARIPVLGSGLNPKRPFMEGAVRWGLLEIQGWRKYSVAKCQKRLDHTGRSGRGQQVPDHRFDRSDTALGPLPAGFPPQLCETFQLRQITKGSAGPVTFDQIDIMG